MSTREPESAVRVFSRSAEAWFEGRVVQLMEFNIGDHTALKLAEADTRREALDEATRDAPPGAGDGLGSQTEPDEEGMADNAVETMSLTEAPASSKRGSSASARDSSSGTRNEATRKWNRLFTMPGAIPGVVSSGADGHESSLKTPILGAGDRQMAKMVTCPPTASSSSRNPKPTRARRFAGQSNPWGA